MDDLLSAFDPLHQSGAGSSPSLSNSKGKQPLFESPTMSTTSVGGNNTNHRNATSTGFGLPRPAAIQSAPVNLSQGPLDLLSFDEDIDNSRHGHTNSITGTPANDQHAIQSKAAARQQEMLHELQGAEQPIDWQTQTLSSARSAPPRTSEAQSTHPPALRRSGFSPPRRLSRSGLMYDDAIFPTRQSSRTHSQQNMIPPGSPPLAPITMKISEDPIDLFHPSSPPDGTTLDAMRKSSYMSSINPPTVRQFLSGDAPPSGLSRASKKNSFNGASSIAISPPQENQNSHPIVSTSSSWTTKVHPTQTQPKTQSKAAPARPRKPLKDLDFSYDPYSASKTARSAPPTAIPSAIDTEPLPPVKLKIPLVAGSTKIIMNEDIADGIRTGLTSRLRLCRTWSLAYSLDAHGTSLSTLYSRVQMALTKSDGGCVLLVKDMEGSIFGAYVNEAFKKSEGYYGNGECFLWKVSSFPSGDDFRVGPIVKIYKWTGRNDYMILSDSTFLSVGGGNGKFGLWIDSDFDKGFTTTCPAFNNEVLCAPKKGSTLALSVDGVEEAKFEIQAVECWAVG